MVWVFNCLKFLQWACISRIALSQPEVIKCMQELLAEVLCPVWWKQLDELLTVPLAFKACVEEFVISILHMFFFTCGLLALWELENNKTETE